MHIDLGPETERLVREEISSGHFRSVDELIDRFVDQPEIDFYEAFCVPLPSRIFLELMGLPACAAHNVRLSVAAVALVEDDAVNRVHLHAGSEDLLVEQLVVAVRPAGPDDDDVPAGNFGGDSLRYY